MGLGGQIDPVDWAFPYLDDEHAEHSSARLFEADALLLGCRTYEGLGAAYPAMAPSPFVNRMNAIRKYVASRTLASAAWNADVIRGDVPSFVADLKGRQGLSLVKYGNGPLDVDLMAHGLIDEFHILLAPVSAGRGRHLFEELETPVPLALSEVRTCRSGVVVLVYTPHAL